jgi:hypothetical protein
VLHRDLPQRQGKVKYRALFRLGFNPDSPTLLLENPFADSQPDTCPFILLAAMQTLKDLEDPVEVFGIDANAVVGY